ncbi:hypothetical protein C8F04DRAFT_1280764 [Mycena alexandri]|uniref:Uncharacterized protein n=1 Tax=Mycena alexandri TaxID=1745969 RepID=A0AAD6RWG5_9AGAR|nr:hypothetical protein C8F04DRAFT_1280764 [Mycena alexandri]
MSAIQSSHTITTEPDTTLQVLTSLRLPPDFPLILPTLRGWGVSTEPADPTAYKVIDNADDLAAWPAAARSHPRRTFHGREDCAGARGARRFGALLMGRFLVPPAPMGKLEPSAEMREQQIAAYSSKELAERTLKHVLLGPDVGVAEMRLLVEDCVSGSESAMLAWPKYAIWEDCETLASGTAEGLKVPVIAVVGGDRGDRRRQSSSGFGKGGGICDDGDTRGCWAFDSGGGTAAG